MSEEVAISQSGRICMSFSKTCSVDIDGVYHDCDIETSDFMKEFEADLGRESALSTTPAPEYVTGLTLAWKDVRVVLPESLSGCLPCYKKFVPSKTIINQASGIVTPGSVMAILGGSGSGKTTLLNSITRRDLGPLNVQGQILLNGREIGDDINFFSGYIQQEDVFPGNLTVKEHLWFTAKLRMGTNYTDVMRESRIEQTMNELGLKKCENTPIGSPGRKKGLSGGEKKRLAFASELLRNPMLLFADEPTSGLDAFSAQTVVRALINMASKGRTILCTIHQPSSNVYNLFPQVMYLTEGDIAYAGANKTLMEFFSSAGFQCPKGYNPADFAIQCLAIVPGREDECRKRNKALVMQYEQSKEKDTMVRLVDLETRGSMASHAELMLIQSDGGTQAIGKFKAPFTEQFYWLFWRYFLPFRRSIYQWSNTFALLIFAVILGFLYFQTPYNQLGLANINSSVFIVTIQISFTTGLSVATDLGSDLANFKKEMKSKTYTVQAYYLAKAVTLLPSIILNAIVYGTIVYWLSGLYNDFGTFAIYILAILMLNLSMASIGRFSAAVAKSGEVAANIVPPLIGLSLIFSGALLRESSLLIFLQWITYISPYNYAYTAILINQWRNVDNIGCGPYTNADGSEPVACFNNGMEVLQSLNQTPDYLPFCFLYGYIVIGVLESLSFLVFWRKSKNL